MISDDQDRKHLENLTGMALSMAMKKGLPKESRGLDKRFRCPNDGSTNTPFPQEPAAGGHPPGSTPPALRVECRLAPSHRPGFRKAESSPGQASSSGH